MGVTLALACVAAMTLTGCRTDTPEAGFGVQVGDRSVPLKEVDRTAEAICAASLPDLQEAGRVVPMSAARAQAAALTADRLRAEELADEFGVPAGGEAYFSVRAEASEFGAVPADLTDAFVDAASTAQLLQDVALEVGRRDLARQGEAAPSDEAAGTRGMELFLEHVEKSELRFDPRLGVTVEEGVVVPAANGTSVAASQWSLTALGPESETVAAGLPDNQTCG